MKTAASLFATALLAATTLPALAGSLGGPAPFRNGSPLPSGTDGSYNLVATGSNNLTGIIKFSIQDGMQTTTVNRNNWVFFVDGDILTGSTAASINDNKVTGILDSGLSSSIPRSADGTVQIPVIIYVPGNAGSGSFNGKIDLNSPTAAIKGTGMLSGTSNRTDQIILISGNGTGGAGAFIDNSTISIPGSSLAETQFKIRGARVSQNSISFSDQLSGN